MKSQKITGDRRRRGERHPRSTCSDHEVDLAIELVEQCRMSSYAVAKKMDVAARTVQRWVRGARRARNA